MRHRHTPNLRTATILPRAVRDVKLLGRLRLGLGALEVDVEISTPHGSRPERCSTCNLTVKQVSAVGATPILRHLHMLSD